MSIMAMFNTLARKREKNFQAVCTTFEREGVTTLEQAIECREVMLSNAKTYVAFVTLLGLSLAMLLSSVAVPILLGMGVLILYIIASTYRGRQLVQRFINEVLPELEKAQDKSQQESEPLNNPEKSDA